MTKEPYIRIRQAGGAVTSTYNGIPMPETATIGDAWRAITTLHRSQVSRHGVESGLCRHLNHRDDEKRHAAF